MSILDHRPTTGPDVRADHRRAAQDALTGPAVRRVVCLRRRRDEESAEVQALLAAYMEAAPGLAIAEAPHPGSPYARALNGRPNSVHTDGTWLWLHADIAVMHAYDWWPDEPDFVHHVLCRVAATF